VAIPVIGFTGLALGVRTEEGGPLRIVSHNVLLGFLEKPGPRRGEWLTRMAERRPDVVALQELNGYTPERLAADARAWGHTQPGGESRHRPED
jgi:hypothetical protein